MLGVHATRACATGIAYPTLATWIGEGVYDDLLAGLGDGMAAGLRVGLGEDGTDTVFRRSFSALVLAECVDRAPPSAACCPTTMVLRWGDRLAGWLVRERDLRGYVPGKGWAHAVAHGADALGALAGSPAPRAAGADRAARRGRRPAAGRHRDRLVHGEDDRLAAATMQVLRRDLVGIEVLEPWVARLAAHGRPAERTTPRRGGRHRAGASCGRCTCSWCSARPAPACRADLLLVLVDALRASNRDFLT